MPSSKTPAGAAEVSASGNSGNPSTSMKLSNANAVQTRGALSNGSTKFDSKMETNVTQPSGTSVGQPPAQSNVLNSTGRQDNVEDLSYDRYRNSDNPGSRPSRQLGEAEEDKPASISIKAFDGTEIITGYSSFFLQGVSEAEQEKYQIVETFTAYYTFFFGKRPPIYTYSGILLNDPEQNWMNTFRFLYENYFRGTAAAELGAQAIVTYDKRAVSGYLLGLNINQDAMSDKGVPFTFNLLVITHDLVGFSSDFDAFIANQQARLKDLRDRAAADVKTLNKEPDTLQTILKNSVLKGKLPAAFAKNPAEAAVTTPPSTLAVTDATKTAENLAHKSIAGLDTYGTTTSTNATGLQITTE